MEMEMAPELVLALALEMEMVPAMAPGLVLA